MADIRQPAVAGMFYPGSAAALQQEVARCLANQPSRARGRSLFAVVAPHAGYAYSGPIAGAAYQALTGRSFQTVVLLGPSHRYPFRGASPALYEAYRTPLGEIEVDQELGRRLEGEGPFSFQEAAHRLEHSLEVQLPFLQTTLRPGFRILPVLFGSLSGAGVEAAAEALAAVARERGEDLLFVCSTDLSHDYPYNQAVEMDKQIAVQLEALDYAGLEQVFAKHAGEACGEKGLLVLLRVCALLGGMEAVITDLRNSGDVVGDKGSRIVGYLSALILRGGGDNA